MSRVWSAGRPWQEGAPIRYVFYDNEGKTEQFMNGPVPVSVAVVLTPEDALDLAWSLFEDVSKVAPDLAGPSVQRATYDTLDRAIKEMKAEFARSLESLPKALKQKDDEWKSVYRLKPASAPEAKLECRCAMVLFDPRGHNLPDCPFYKGAGGKSQ